MKESFCFIVCLIAVSLLHVSCGAEEATYQGKRASEWARDLKDADVETRVAAVEALGGRSQLASATRPSSS